MVQEIFTPEVIERLPGAAAIGHTRYSTAGDTDLINAQPIVIDCNKGKLALAHNGNLTNAARAAPRARAPRRHLPDHQRHRSDRALWSPAATRAICPALWPKRSTKSRARIRC